jgi:hypothetical protein
VVIVFFTNGALFIILPDEPEGGTLVGKPQLKDMTVVIEDASGNTITLRNGKITIQSIGVLELKAPTIVVNGRPVLPNSNPI